MHNELQSKFRDFYQDSGLGRLFSDIGLADKKQHFHSLKLAASKDLSWAHCIQHDQAAKITLKVSQAQVAEPFLSQIAANSTQKKPDTCYIKHGRIHGEKFYISAVTMADYAVIYVFDQDTNQTVNVYVPEGQFDIDVDSFRPLGMERTLTGNLRFHGQLLDESQILISRQDKKIFARDSYMDFAFATNCIGLCFGLCADIENFLERNQIADVEWEFNKLKLDLFSYEQIWLAMLDKMIDTVPSTDYYNYSFLLYNNGKKTLNNLCKFILDNGTGVFYQLNAGSQKFRDALIYTSHMHNLRVSTQEFFRHRKHLQ